MVAASVVRLIEQHFASVGTVMFIRPVLLSFGFLAPGARQYRVDIQSPLGGQSYTVEVENTGEVRTILAG
jgi:hypothetical protein